MLTLLEQKPQIMRHLHASMERDQLIVNLHLFVKAYLLKVWNRWHNHVGFLHYILTKFSSSVCLCI